MTSNGILDAVKEKAHYAITMLPRSPKNLSFVELEEIVEYCTVKRRELSYPYAPGGKVQRLERCIEASHMGGLHAGVWRLYKSGQFKEYLGLYEARWPQAEPSSAMSGTPLRERFLEPVVTLYQISEVFLFASRLAKRIPDVWRIEIKLCDMQDRFLDIRVPKRYGLYTDYRCSVPTIVLSTEIDSWSLESQYADLALKKTLEVMGIFGWSEKWLETTLREDQERLYRQGETRAMPVPIGRGA